MQKSKVMFNSLASEQELVTGSKPLVAVKVHLHKPSTSHGGPRIMVQKF